MEWQDIYDGWGAILSGPNQEHASKPNEIIFNVWINSYSVFLKSSFKENLQIYISLFSSYLSDLSKLNFHSLY